MDSNSPVVYFIAESEAYAPKQAYEHDAGYDIYASEDAVLDPWHIDNISTGLFIEMPPDVWALLIGRSSMARKRRVRIEPAIIDPGYRGEIFVGAQAVGSDPCLVQRGERIAQLVFMTRVAVNFQYVTSLNPSQRHQQGIGSSGR